MSVILSNNSLYCKNAFEKNTPEEWPWLWANVVCADYFFTIMQVNISPAYLVTICWGMCLCVYYVSAMTAAGVAWHRDIKPHEK